MLYVLHFDQHISTAFYPFWQCSIEIDIFLFYSDGVMTEKLCPDGMVFNDYDSDVEKCDLPYNIDCTKRPKLRKYLLNRPDG